MSSMLFLRVSRAVMNRRVLRLVVCRWLWFLRNPRLNVNGRRLSDVEFLFWTVCRVVGAR